MQEAPNATLSPSRLHSASLQNMLEPENQEMNAALMCFMRSTAKTHYWEVFSAE